MSRSTQEQPFRVAITGGGIGGLFAALSIHHHCTEAGVPVKIDVYEQASRYREIGASIGLGVNATRLVHRLGLGDKLNDLGGVVPGHFLNFRRYDTNSEMLKIPVPANETVRQTLCERTNVIELFKTAIEEREAATLHTSKRCESIEDLDSGVKINFADSTSAEADLVVASDGIHSNVRKQFVPDKPFYSGFIAYRALVPQDKLPAWDLYNHSNSWICKHRHFLAYPILPSKSVSVVAYVTRPENQVDGVQESWTSHCDRASVKADYDGFHEAVHHIIDNMPDEVPRWRINEREPLKTWSFLDGKVNLLGDAAHAMSPHLGAGAGQAMEDGWVLGRCLADYLSSSPAPHFKSLPSTTGLYQMIRAPTAAKTQEMSKVAGNTYELQTPEMAEKTFEECLPILAQLTRERAKWVKMLYEQDLDVIYEKIRSGADLKAMMAMMAKGMQMGGAGGPPPSGVPPKGLPEGPLPSDGMPERSAEA